MSGHMRLSIIPGWAATDPRLQGRDLQVLCVLGRHIDKDGWCTRSQVKVAREIGCARSTIQASLTRLSAIGLVQIRENVTVDGRDCSHDYRVLFDVEAPEIVAHPPADQSAPPAGIPAPPADPWIGTPCRPMDRHPLPTHGSAPYKNDPLKTIPEELERESAGEEGAGGENLETDGDEAAVGSNERSEALKADSQETSEAIERRFWTFVKDWPGFAGMPKEAAKRAWLKASPADRAEAEAKRDGWLALLRRQGKSHVPAPSTMLSERLFAEVPWPGESAAAPRLAEPPFGPAWCAERIARLLAHRPVVSLSALDRHMIGQGKIDADEAERAKALNARAQMIGFMDDQARQFKGVSVAPAALEAGRGYRAVSAGSDLWQRWQARFAALGWPWLPDMGRHPTAYFPAEGPEGFEILNGDHASGLPLKGGADKQGRAA